MEHDCDNIRHNVLKFGSNPVVDRTVVCKMSTLKYSSQMNPTALTYKSLMNPTA